MLNVLAEGLILTQRECMRWVVRKVSNWFIIEQLDVSTYDLTIDYGSLSVQQKNGGGINMNLIKTAAGSGIGGRISTTRYIQYAKITARMSAVDTPGVVTTFITMSPRKDEIDWEFVGGQTTSAQSNVFYKGILEFGIRSGTHSTGPISVSREYVIDWKSDEITWSVNGNQVRSYKRDSPEAVTAQTPRGERSFPTEPSKIQIGVWDGGSSSSKGVSDWAGGPIPWGDKKILTATYDYIDIQCYDDLNQPVPKWPLDNNPDRKDAPANQRTSAANANAGKVGSDGSSSASVFDLEIKPVEGLPTQTNVGSSALRSMPFLGFLFLLL
jgi:beta-glucanase (GH16 family)